MCFFKYSFEENFIVRIRQIILFILLINFYIFTPKDAISSGANPTINNTNILIGSIMPLTIDSVSYDLNYYSANMKIGIETALETQIVKDRKKIIFEVINDSNDPITTVQAARELIDKGIFLMLGNVGSISTLKLIKVLEANKIPAMGFYIMGDINTGNMLNYRPNPAQEVAKIIDHFVNKEGAKPTEVCLFAQNDIFGMAGINSLKSSLEEFPGTQTIVDKLNMILDMMMGGINPALNSIGPVGLYQYETVFIREGYLSLKNWEQESGNQCKLVILMAMPKVAADFIAYAHYKNEPWAFGAVSVTTAGYALRDYLKSYGIEKNILVTQVVPDLDSSLPIVVEARKNLGYNLNHINLEGYIVGRIFTTILNSMKDPLTQDNFIKTARENVFDIGGLKIDFTKDGSGSTLVFLNNLKSGS